MVPMVTRQPDDKPIGITAFNHQEPPLDFASSPVCKIADSGMLWGLVSAELPSFARWRGKTEPQL